MEQFPDGAHVRLRSLVRRKYLHADEDGTGVFLSPVRASLYAAWRVHRVVRSDVPFVLLHSAAFGRYLAATDDPAPPGHRGQLVVQGMYDHPDENDVVWTVDEAEGGDGVLLHHVSGRLLRANGRRRTWNNGVSVDHPGNRSTMMHWVVEPLQLRQQTPFLLPHVVYQLGGRRGLFRRRTVPLPVRTIRYVLADNLGNFDNDHGWDTFQFQGRAVFNLRWEVRHLVSHDPEFLIDIEVCTRAGRYGRLTPLIIDRLPLRLFPMDIIALTTESPAVQELQYPDVDAP